MAPIDTRTAQGLHLRLPVVRKLEAEGWHMLSLIHRNKTGIAFLRYASPSSNPNHHQENIMGKYFLAWILGVPAGILVLVYLFTHLL
jgi:hypothetical protein